MKGKAPVSDEVLKVKLPRPTEFNLPNGLHVMVLEDHRVPQINFSIIVQGAGGYFDPADMIGVSAFTAAMMREGAGNRTSSQISGTLESMAANLNVGSAAASPDATVSGSGLTEYADSLFSLAADVLLRPTFPDAELARYKQRMQAQLIQQRTNPAFGAVELFNKVTYGSHPGSRTSPTVDALAKVTRDNLVAFHRERFVPDHAAVAISGDITPADARKLVEAKFGAWKKTGAAAPAVTDPPAALAGRVHLVDRPASVQTNFVVGTQAITRTDPDYDALQVANKVLGGGPSARLFVHLREEKGYTYSIGSSVDATRYRGDWTASTDVRTEVTEPALRDLLAEFGHMRDSVVPAKELRDQQRSLVASFALSLENPAQVLNYYVTSWTYQLPADYWDKYPDRVMAVTAAQVQAASKKYLAADKLHVVGVGDGAKISEVLKRFGTVDRYDTDGRMAPIP